MNRPDWNTYLINIAQAVSARSIDPNTKVGCVLVDKKYSILSTGYNSPPRGIKDNEVPLVRPDKYDWIIHAEANAIANAARVGTSLDECISYSTHRPCSSCLKLLISAGCKKIIFKPTKYEMMDTDADWHLMSRICKEAGIELTEL